jgi:hypothetical protein
VYFIGVLSFSWRTEDENAKWGDCRGYPLSCFNVLFLSFPVGKENTQAILFIILSLIPQYILAPHDVGRRRVNMWADKLRDAEVSCFVVSLNVHATV